MPGKNKNPLLGWHPPTELSAWARAEAERRNVPLSAILTEALTEYRRHVGQHACATPRSGESGDHALASVP